MLILDKYNGDEFERRARPGNYVCAENVPGGSKHFYGPIGGLQITYDMLRDVGVHDGPDDFGLWDGREDAWVIYQTGGGLEYYTDIHLVTMG